MKSERRNDVPAVAIFLLIGCYFTAFAVDGLHAYFTLDDGMNIHTMHGYWENSLGDVLQSALHVVTGAYRPLGGIVYLGVFRAAGFTPLPFRAVCLGLMLVNAFVACFILRRLSSSAEVALIGALLFASHPALLDLFYSSATIYDILCFLFYFPALILYLRWRSGAETKAAIALSWRRLALLLALTACALNSKEMAVTLPLALLLMEVIYYPAASWWSPRELTRFLYRQGRAAIATAALVAAIMAAKLLTYNPLAIAPLYRIRLSPGMILEALCRYYDFLLYQDHFLSPPKLLVLWAAMGFLAYALRSRPLKFGFWFLLIGLLPVCVIPIPRNGFVLYLPLIGWSLYVAALFVLLRDMLLKRIAARAPAAIVRAASLALAAGLIVPLHASARSHLAPAIHQVHNTTRQIMEQLQQLRPRLDPGSALLFIDDPLAPEDWSLTFFIRLAYHDPLIWVDRTRMLGHYLSAEELTLYDHVFAYEDGRLRETPKPALASPPASRAAVEVRFLPGRVRPGQSYEVVVPDYASQTIDLAFELRVKRAAYSDVARRWCTLDATGRAALVTPEVHPGATVLVRKIRPQGGPWTPARGAIEVVR